jgi:hypothetical protein
MKAKPKTRAVASKSKPKAKKAKAKKPGRPATGQTPKRYFRIKDEAWEEIIAAATAEGGTISDYLRKVLTRDAQKVLSRYK